MCSENSRVNLSHQTSHRSSNYMYSYGGKKFYEFTGNCGNAWWLSGDIKVSCSCWSSHLQGGLYDGQPCFELRTATGLCDGRIASSGLRPREELSHHLGNLGLWTVWCLDGCTLTNPKLGCDQPCMEEEVGGSVWGTLRGRWAHEGDRLGAMWGDRDPLLRLFHIGLMKWWERYLLGRNAESAATLMGSRPEPRVWDLVSVVLIYG